MKKPKKSLSDILNQSCLIRLGMLVLVMGIFSVLLYPNLVVPRHMYKLGDIADKDIKAPNDFMVEDREGTEEKRREAVRNVLTVYDYDAGLSSKIRKNVQDAFDEVRNIFESESSFTDNEGETSAVVNDSVEERANRIKQAFEKKIGIEVGKGAYKILEKERFSTAISDMIIRITTEIMDNGVVTNKEILLREGDRGIILRTISNGSETVVINLRQYYGLDQAKTMVRVISHPLIKDLNYNVINLIVDFCQRLIQPNITMNRSETEERKKKAEQNVNPIFYKIKEGEMLLREGERVTEVQLLKLRTLDAQRKREKILSKSIGASATILCLILIAYFLYVHRRGLNTNKDILFISIVMMIFFIIPKISGIVFESLSENAPFDLTSFSMTFGIPLAAGAMTVCLFKGLEVAIAFSVVISVCTAVIFQNRFEVFIYFLMNGVMGAYWMQNCRERRVFIKAGLKIGILNIILSTAVDAYMGELSSLRLFWDWAFAFIGGISAGIVTAGLAPLLEFAFGYTTDITLLELANLERPILRRLMIEAPGTYHHSVLVGSMVEAAAAEIGANPLLAKVCAYYHDIGKINKPLYFIENQTDGKNRHDTLAPSMSSLILISHIKDGVEMGKKYRLGQDIIDAIRQHHGTSLIKFFYEKAKQIKGDDSVKIEDFRYPGPRPQTREAGLVMLADVVEAASRTLENPTPSRIQGHVQKLINNVFSDGQLDDCELTLRDLHNIADSFNKILNGIHHHRIEYAESSNGKEKKDKEKNDKSG